MIKPPKAFTLVELLVVVAIIGIIVGITLPAVQRVRESARQVVCSNQVRQLSIGLLNLESSHGRLPSGVTSETAKPYGRMTWLVRSLPFIEQQAVWQNTIRDYQLQPSPFFHPGLLLPIPAFACPSDSNVSQPQWTHNGRLVALTNYLGINGTNYRERDGIFHLDSTTTLQEITDGQSNTLMIGERPPSPDFWYGWWYAGYGQEGSGSGDMLLGVAEIKAETATYLQSCPTGPYGFSPGKNTMCDTLHFWSFHPGGAHFGIADGAVKFLSYEISMVTLQQLSTKAKGEVITELW